MKGTSEDTTYLVAGIIILLIVAFLVYSLIGGDCGPLAQRSASNIRTAIETVATTPGYTKDNPYPTFIMLCQDNVKNPITLNPFDSKALTYPEYMIYWEHFPESPSLAGSFVIMDESYPFTKNFAQIAAISYGSTAVFGTFGLLAKSAKFAKVAGKFKGTRVGKMTSTVFGAAKKFVITSGKVAFAPLIWSHEALSYMAKRGEYAFKKLIFDRTVKKYLTARTVSEAYGKSHAYGILSVLSKSGAELEEKGLLDAVENAGTGEILVKMIKTDDGIKAAVKKEKWGDLGSIIEELEKSDQDVEKNLATLLKKNFASPDEYDEAVKNGRAELMNFEKIIDEAESGKKGFSEFISTAMDQAKTRFKSKLDEIAETKGMHSGRPVMEMLDTRAVKELTENDEVLFQIGMELDIVQAKGSKMIKKTADGYELTTEFKSEIDQWAQDFHRSELKIKDLADLKTKLKDAFKAGRVAMSGAERDSAMIASFESWIRKSLASDETPGRLKNLLTEFDDYAKGTGSALSKSKNEELGQSFKNAYKEELKENKVKDEFIEAAFKRLSKNAGEGDETGKLGQNLFSEYGAALKKAYEYSGNDMDKAHEMATLALMWRRDPAMVIAMMDNGYTFDAARRLLVTEMESFMIADTFEQQLKYAYLKDDFAGCDDDNIVCVNSKGVEQKKGEIPKDQRAEYEKAYKVSTPVSVKLERAGFIGGGIGQFILTEDPRFHVVSPCIAKAGFYSTGECVKDESGNCTKDPKTGRDIQVIMGKVDPCYVGKEASNYCYYPTAKAELAAVGFWGSLGCSITSDFLKLGGIGFLTQLACAGIDVETERETTWPFDPFEPLSKNDMSIVNCEVEKNPEAASKLLLTACCNQAKCDPNYKCLGAEYAAKNNALCGKPVCTLQDLANKAGMDYKQACPCQ